MTRADATRTNRSARAWVPVTLMIAAAPIVIFGVLSVRNDTTDMRQWLPDGRIEKARYERFVGNFGPDDVLVVSWPGCTLDDPRLPQFASTLLERGESHLDGEQTSLFRSVKTGPMMIDRLTAPPVDLSREQAITRLVGFAIGPDRRTTCALVEFTSAGKQQPHAVVETIVAAAKEAAGIERPQMRMGGGIYEVTIIDDESTRSLRQCAGWSCLIGLVAAWLSLRSLRVTTCVVFIGVYCSGMSVALVHFGGGSLNAVMIVLPTLIFVLVISGAVHMVNYYRDALHLDTSNRAMWDSGRQTNAQRAFSAGWLPCTLAAVTTAIGMMSLAISQIRPVRLFGYYSAIGLLASLAVMLGFLHAVFTWFSHRGDTRADDNSSPKMRSHRWSDLLALFVVRRYKLTTVASLCIFLTASLGLLFTQPSVNLKRMFRSENELIKNYQWLETNIGPLAALEVVIHFDKDCRLSMLERLQMIDRMERRLKTFDATGATVSATLVAPRSSRTSTIRATVRRAILNRRLTEARPNLLQDGLLAEDDGDELWRISVRLPALRDFDYGMLTNQVQEQVEAVITASHKQNTDTSDRLIWAEYTGAFPMIQGAQKQLLADLTYSFLLAFLLITPVMMLILRGVLPGLAAMLANITPAATVFGGMGWLGIPIDIGTVLTASVAIGVAVDDTLHLLTWFRRGLREGKSRRGAIRLAAGRCGTAMVQTTLICGLGMLAFAGGTFVPASRFAWLMFALLVSALVGDLILLPALLAGPLGRVFVQAKRARR